MESRSVPPSQPTPSSPAPLAFENVTVRFDEHRWDVRIVVTEQDGTERTFIASADSYYTDRDGVWFGTQEEHDAWPD